MTGKQVQASHHRPGGGFASALRLIFHRRTFAEIPRLLREGPAPVVRLLIQAHNTAEIARLLAEGKQVNFVSSFPRSGNTWMRYLLSDVFLQNQGIPTATQLPVHPDKIVPDFYCHWIARRAESVPTPGVFVKTHDGFEQLQERFYGKKTSRVSPQAEDTSPFRKCKHVYLYRSPADALVSFYHFHYAQTHLKDKARDGIDAFCRAHLGAWEENMSGYLRAAESGFPVLFVPYELLLHYPEEILSDILRWLGAKHESATVARAISNMQFSKLQAVATRNLFKEDATSFRRGCKGSSRLELQEATLAAIDESASHLVEKANQRVLAQRSQQRTPASSHTGQIRWQAAIQHKPSNPLPPVPTLQRT